MLVSPEQEADQQALPQASPGQEVQALARTAEEARKAEESRKFRANPTWQPFGKGKGFGRGGQMGGMLMNRSGTGMLQCFVCGGNHYQSDCPKVKSGERQPVQLGMFPSQVGWQQQEHQQPPQQGAAPPTQTLAKGAGRGGKE